MFVICAFIPIFFIQTFRAEAVGLDTVSYIRGYYRINYVDGCWEAQNWEWGYVLLNRMIGKLTNCNVQFLFGAVSAVILIGVGCFILQNSGDKSVFWSVFFYITLNHYLTSMCSMRQYIAIAIGINIYTLLKKECSVRTYLASALLLALALAFHTSAFVLASVFIIFALKKVNRKTIVISTFLCIMAFLCFDEILDIFFIVFPKYYAYSQTRFSKFAGVALGNTYILFLLLKILVSGLVFTLNPVDKKNRELYILLLLSLFGAAVSIMTVKVMLVWRFGYYFDIFLLLLIPETVSRIRKIRPVLYLLLMAMGWMYYLFLLHANSAGCVPYGIF